MNKNPFRLLGRSTAAALVAGSLFTGSLSQAQQTNSTPSSHPLKILVGKFVTHSNSLSVPQLAKLRDALETSISEAMPTVKIVESGTADLKIVGDIEAISSQVLGDPGYGLPRLRQTDAAVNFIVTDSRGVEVYTKECAGESKKFASNPASTDARMAVEESIANLVQKPEFKAIITTFANGKTRVADPGSLTL